jgi:hypothetical protein
MIHLGGFSSSLRWLVGTSFGTRGSQVQILPLRPVLSRKSEPHRHRFRHRIAEPMKNVRDRVWTMCAGAQSAFPPREHRQLLSTETLSKRLRVLRLSKAEHHEVVVITGQGVRERRRG